MSMHGMTKEEYLASRTEENLAKRKALGLEWKEKFARLTQMKKDSEFTDEGLRLTERLLDFNSDCYTIWNFRRLILLSKIREANEEQARLAIEAAEQHHNQQQQHEQQPPHEEEPASELVEEKKDEGTKEEQATTEETKTESGEQAQNENEAKSKEQSEEGQQPETVEEQTPKAEGEGEEEKKEEEKKELTEEEKKALLDEKLRQIEEAKVKRLCTLFERELDAITSPAIKRNPKSYWPWNHRVWCIQQLQSFVPASTPPAAEGDKPATQTTKDMQYFWKKELGLCELFLRLDGRNFHCWNYRSFITEKAGVTLQQELAFTEQKIGEGGQFFFASAGGKNSFSNYSAWHLRSKVLGQLWDDMLANHKDEEYWQSVDEEFRLLEQSLVMHDGESPWQYHRWLMTKVPSERKEEMIQRELELIDEIISTDEELSPNKPPKWAMLSKVYLLQELAELKGKDEEQREKTRDLIAKLTAHDPFRKNYYAYLLDKYQKAN